MRLFIALGTFYIRLVKCGICGLWINISWPATLMGFFLDLARLLWFCLGWLSRHSTVVELDLLFILAVIWFHGALKCKLLLPVLVLRPSTMLLPMLLRNSFGYLNFSDNSKSVFLLLPDFYATKTMLFSLLPTRWPNLAPKILILTIISFGNLLLKRLLVSALSPHTSSWLMFSQKGWPDYSFYWIVASCAFFHHANFEGDIRGKSDSSDNNQDISDSPWL